MLLGQVGIEPDALRPSSIDEQPHKGEMPRSLVTRLARAKAETARDLIGNDKDGPTGYYDPATGRFVGFDTRYLSTRGYVAVRKCGRFGRLQRANDGKDLPDGLFDSDTLRTTPIPNDISWGECPIVSHDGSVVAFSSLATGPIAVSLANGKITQIGRQGTAVAWSGDDGLSQVGPSCAGC